MATHDRFPLPELPLQTHPESEPVNQGELFAQLALRALPLMKGTPEDFWILPEPAARVLH